MNTANWVTDFKLEDAAGKPIKVSELVKAVEAHCKQLLEGESFCCSADWDKPGALLPARYRWLIAFAVEGESEADYVHIGAIQNHERTATPYIDFGFVKLWNGQAQALAVANEAQRFLQAARWN